MKNKDLWIYRINTGLLTLLMGFSATMYFVQYEKVSDLFLSLGFPVFIVYPLAVAKLLGLIAIWSNRSRMLKEWAYAGFFFDTALATGSHIMAGDGGQYAALFGLALVIVSRIFWGKLGTTG